MKELINKNLVSLKCVLFAFFAGVGCLFPFLPLHVRALGISAWGAAVISMVVPFFALFGPLLVGLLADRFSVGRGCETTIVSNGKGSGIASSSGGNRFLRFLLAACLLLSALFYLLLLAVPTVTVFEPRRPSVSFMCDSQGATVFQEMCAEVHHCNHWSNEKSGKLLLSNCRYACERPPVAEPLFILGNTSSTTQEPVSSEDTEEDDDDLEADNDNEPSTYERLRRDENLLISLDDIPPPHLCQKRAADDVVTCHAYTPDTKHIVINTGLLAKEEEEEYEPNDDNETIWCKYPLADSFTCSVPKLAVLQLEASAEYNTSCNPVIQCSVEDPYDSEDSVLAESQCKLYVGDPHLTFWLYLIFRTLADLFATSSLCLLCTACIIATRETSVGRGDPGRQLAWGAIGAALLPPLACWLHQCVQGDSVPPYLALILVAGVMFIIAALITLWDGEMPVSPPEWWWHTKSGMLALPMNTVRRYSLETGALMLVLTLLGVCWSTLDAYLPWTLTGLEGTDMLLALTVTLGALPAIPILWKAEKLVDYCGHSNIFIAAFTFYIIRFAGMAVVRESQWLLLCEVLEVCTLHLCWITAVLYFRHLAPRRFTCTGQALPVIAHFCLGRFLGAVLGSSLFSAPSVEQQQWLYRAMSLAAAITAGLYLLCYHLILAPMCRADSTGPPNPMLMQGLGTNGGTNGSYTPLRVYHNERGRKGQFRY